MYRHPAKRVQAAVASFRVGDMVWYSEVGGATPGLKRTGLVMEFISAEDSVNGLPYVEVMDNKTAKLVEVLRDQVKKIE